MATLANGGTIPDHFTIVDSPITSGNTLVQVESTPLLDLPQIPMVLQHGTQPTVETAVALQEIQCIDDAHQDHQPHNELTTPPLTSQ